MSVTGKRIFMTGASGFLGTRVTKFAVDQGYEVYGLSRSEASDAKLKSAGGIPVRGHLESLDIITQESAKADIVFHLADSQSGGNWGTPYEEFLRIDFAAVDAIGEGLKDSGKVFVTTSGTMVVASDHGRETDETSPLWEKPLNQRVLCEQHALTLCKKGIKAMAVRLAPYVYGFGSSGIALFMSMAPPAGEISYVGDGAVQTTAVHVDDAARLFLLVAQKGKSGEAYNGSSQNNITYRELYEAMGAALNLPVRSLSYEEMVAKVGEFFARFQSTENRASNTKAVQELGWKPHEIGLLDDITKGSYQAVAKNLVEGSA